MSINISRYHDTYHMLKVESGTHARILPSLLHIEGQECNVSSDCPYSQCCISSGGLREKRETAMGQCMVMGQLGEGTVQQIFTLNLCLSYPGPVSGLCRNWPTAFCLVQRLPAKVCRNETFYLFVACLVNNQDLDMASVAFYVSCPCGDGLNCAGSGTFNIPLGEEGTCQGNSAFRLYGLSGR